MTSMFRTRITRRDVVKSTLAAGVAASIGNSTFGLASEATSPVITKSIPSTGERLPVVGLGTNAYGVTEPAEIAARREVLQQFPVLGARVVDTARGYGESEVVIGKLVAELGNREQLFLA